MLPYPFNLLDEKIQDWIRELGFLKPTKIQELSIEPILRGENVLLIAPTGSGKTEAAILPLLHRILREDTSIRGVKLVYINPLKALTRDLAERIRRYSEALNILIRPLYGDVSKGFKEPVPDIIVTTPESLEVILDWAPRWFPHLRTIKYIIIDEVHELVYSKRGYQLLALLERLKQITGRPLQRIGLSATLASPELVARMLGGSDGPLKVIQSSEKREYLFKIEFIAPDNNEGYQDPFKLGAEKIIKHLDNKKTLIFTNSRYTAERLKAELEKENIPSGVHHGSIGFEEREYMEDMFKQGMLKCIIATKTLELGIDIGDTDQVIQFGSPGQVIALLQRAGRSLHRPGEKAYCIVISLDPEDYLENLALIRLYEKGFLEEPTIIEKPLDVLAKEILGYSLHNKKSRGKVKDVEKPYSLEDIYSTMKQCYLFRELTYEEFLEVVDLLRKEKIINIVDNIPYPGRKFWEVWGFEGGKALLGFSEFFSLIPKRETFTVYLEEGFGRRREIGELDSSFVYKALNVGMIIRLAGSNWRVVDIDERNNSVFVVGTKEAGETPLWRGEGPQRSMELAKEILSILFNLKHEPKLIHSICGDEKCLTILRDYVSKVEDRYLNVIMEGKIIIEYIPLEKTWFFITFKGEKVNRTLAASIYEKAIEKSLLIKYLVTPIGFAIKSEVVNPLLVLRTIDVEEFENLIRKHLLYRSIFAKLLAEQIKEHFGFPGDDVLILKEAGRQALLVYYDLGNALEVLRKIKNGQLVVIEREKMSQLAESIAKYSFEKISGIDLKQALKEVLEKTHTRKLDHVIEYLWSSPEEALKSLRELSATNDIVVYLDPEEEGWSVARVPIDENSWASIKVPIATRFINIGNRNELEKTINEFSRRIVSLKSPLNKQVEIILGKFDAHDSYPYKLMMKNITLFEKLVESIINKKLDSNKFRKLDVRVHVERSGVTMIHRNAPRELAKYLIIWDVIVTNELIRKGIISGKRVLIFDLP